MLGAGKCPRKAVIGTAVELCGQRTGSHQTLHRVRKMGQVNSQVRVAKESGRGRLTGAGRHTG